MFQNMHMKFTHKPTYITNIKRPSPAMIVTKNKIFDTNNLSSTVIIYIKFPVNNIASTPEIAQMMSRRENMFEFDCCSLTGGTKRVTHVMHFIRFLYSIIQMFLIRPETEICAL